MNENKAGIYVKGITPYLFILPIIIGIGLFGFACFVYVLKLSFTKTSLIGNSSFVGLKNYFYVLFQTKWFLIALSHTLYYVIWSVPLNLVVGLGLALAMYRKIKFGSFFRFTYLLPWVSSLVIIALIFRYIFNPEWGIVNYILNFFRIKKIAWTEYTSTAIPVVAMISAWQGMGFGMIIFMGAINAIPKEIFEAASLEGASKLQMFYYITLPLIKSTIFFYLVVLVIGAFQVFDSVFIFSEGDLSTTMASSLGSRTLTCSYFTYLIAFRQFAFGKASSMAILMFIITLAVILIQRHFIGRKVIQY